MAPLGQVVLVLVLVHLFFLSKILESLLNILKRGRMVGLWVIVGSELNESTMKSLLEVLQWFAQVERLEILGLNELLFFSHPKSLGLLPLAHQLGL